MPLIQRSSKLQRGASRKKGGSHLAMSSRLGMMSFRSFVVSSIAVGVVSVLGLALLQGPKFLHRFPINEVEIEGTLQFVDRVALRSVISSYADITKSGNYFAVNLAALRRDIQALPWVESVDVRKVWPDTLQLAISERVAIAIWQDTRLISHKGDLFEPEKMLESTALPRLYGPNDKARYVMENFHQMSKVLRITQLKIIKLRLAERLAWQLRLNNQIEVMIDKDQSVEKLLGFVDLYPRLQESHLTNEESKIAKVDLRYSNGIAITWKGV